MAFGYIRVSTKEQHIDRQLMALEPFGIPSVNIFIEKKSGKNLVVRSLNNCALLVAANR